MKEKINVAVIGLGNRGSGMLGTICMMDDVDVIGVCDEYEDRAQDGIRRVEEKRVINLLQQQITKKSLSLRVLTAFISQQTGQLTLKSLLKL